MNEPMKGEELVWFLRQLAAEAELKYWDKKLELLETESQGNDMRLERPEIKEME